ncbi:hypothetical protein IWQ62_004489 [Dispira parvispora]|uniref:Uncharacterized protein n=1 Tax=Dispira parvispora TaxID=1520584 RepID=A0A9W8E5D0_9FUNG|nr:hypothetical protein IWQ62_004489 [Dispira parvispora]
MIVEGGDDSEFGSTESTDTPKESPVSIDSSEEVEVLGNDCEEAVTEDIAVEATEESVSTVPDAVSADADVSAEQPQVASVETAAEESLEAEVIVPEPTEEVSEVPHSVEDSISQTVEVDKVENSTPEAAAEVVEEVQTSDCHADVVVLEGVKGESAVPESTETPVESVEVSEGSPAKIDTAVDSVEDIVESIPSQDVEVTIATVPESVPIEEAAATEMPLGESTETTTTVAAEMEAVAASIEVDTEPTVTEANEESATADQQEVTVEHPQIEPAEVVAEEISKTEVVVPESIVEVSEESPSQSVEACQVECAGDEFVPDDSVIEETVEKLEEEVLVATIQDATPALLSENEVEVAVDSLNSVEAAALLYLTTANCSGNNKHVTAVPDNSVIFSESANAEIPSDAAVDDIVSRDSVTNGPQVSQEDVSEQADDCPEIDDLNSEVIHVVRDQLNAETVDDCSVVMADPPAAVEETSPTASDMVHTPTDDTEMAEAFSQSEIAAAESDDLSSEVAIGATVESDGIKVEAVDKVENAQDVSSVGDILPKLTVDVSDESCESIAVGDGQTTESTISDMNSGTVAISEAVPVTHTETEVVAAVESHVPQTDDRDAPVFVHSGISVETASNSAEPEVNDSQILSVAGCGETVDGIIECEQSFSAAEVVANKKCSNSAQVEPVSPHTVQSNDAASEIGSSAEAASKAEPTQFVETTNVNDDLKPGADDKDEPVGEAVPPATKTENDLVMSETSSNHCVDESTRDTEVATDADCPLQSVAELDPTYSVQVVIVSPLAGQEVTTDEDAGVTFAEVIKEISLSNEPVLNVTNQSAVEDEPLQEPTKVPQDTVANDQPPTDVTPATGECPVVESLTVSHEETDSTTVMDKTSEIPSTEDTTPEIEDGKHSAVVDQTTLPSVTADIPSSCADPTPSNEAADNNEIVPSTEQPPHEKESVELLDTTPTAPDEPMSSTSCKESTGFVKPPSTEMATSSPDEPTVVSAPEETEAVECVVTHTVADDASSELPADTYQAEEFPAESAKQPNLEDTLSREVNEGGELPNVADESEPVVNVEPISSVSTAHETSEASLEVSNTVTTAGSCAVESVDHEVAIVAEAVSAEEPTSLKDTPASCQDNVDSLNNAVATSTVDTVEKALSEECPPVTNPDLPSVEGKESNVVMVEKQEVQHASSKEVLLTRSNDVQQRSEVNPVEVKVGATTVDQDISVTENHVAAVANKQQEKVVPTACTSKLYETDDGDGQESVASFTTADEGRDIKLHTDTVELGEDNPVPFPTPSRGSTDSAIGMGEAENDPSKVDPSTADVSETPIEGDLATATQTPDNSETPSIASKTSKRRRRRSSVWKRLKGWFTG